MMSAALGGQIAAADPMPRAQPAAGSVIAHKVGEEVRFVEVSDWRFVDLQQDVVAGDYLRTNANGNLAVLFADRTQMRLGRNTTLLVKNAAPGQDAEFALESGTIWARAERGGTGLTVDTPAAAAAIRGTDWTLTVDGNGRTSLIVLEGKVELSNDFGTVTAVQGETAVATIGSAPTKVIIVNPSDREQMQFFMSLRGSFNALPASPLSSPDMRKARGQISAKAPATRSAEDWVTLAEVSLSYDGRQGALEASRQARGFRLTRAQAARLDLIDAMIAGAEKRYDEASRLFKRAAPALDKRRRAVAAYGGYYSRALADPTRTETPPKTGDGPYAAVAEAMTAGFLVDIKAAIAVLEKAERRYPDDPTLPAARAQFATLLDDRQKVEEAVERALTLDPDEPMALEARANYRAAIKGDLEGAHADLTRATELAPGSTTLWNSLGLVQNARGASSEAETALLRAIELDPQDPVSHINLAYLYLDQDRVEEARKEIETALKVDPTFDIALLARGRYHMQTGELEKAREDLMAGTTASPADSQGLLLLSAAHYESGDREPAAQALDNANRLDPNNPVSASFKTAVAIDGYDSDTAIRSAQEMLKRTRARGGDFAALSANHDEGSTLNDAYRLQGMDARGRYYGEAVFDPFSAAGYVDQTVAGAPNPFVNQLDFGGTTPEPSMDDSAFSTFFQGLMLNPAMISGRSRSANLVRRPFIEGSLGGGFISTGRDGGWTTEAEVQGYAANPVPWSIYGNLNVSRSDQHREEATPGSPVTNVSFDLRDSAFSGTGYITARPTPNDRLVAYVSAAREKPEFLNSLIVPVPPQEVYPGLAILGIGYNRAVENEVANYGVGWSHTFGYRNVLNTAIFASGYDGTSNEQGIVLFDVTGTNVLGQRTIEASTKQQSYIGAINHIYGTGDVTWRYGVEGGVVDQTQSEYSTINFLTFPLPTDITDLKSDLDLNVGKAYVDAIYDVTPTLKAEAGLFGTILQSDSYGASFSQGRLAPRIGAAWAPAEGHWLRAAYLQETSAVDTATLAPVGVVGIQSNQVPLALGGYTSTFATRWDAEWSDRLFTSLDYQHQSVHNLSVPIPGGIDTIDLTEGRIDRLAATANYWIGGGFAAFATFTCADSKNEDPSSGYYGEPLPYVPEAAARVGGTWVSPANLKVTLAGTYVGKRAGDVTGTQLSPYWTADAFATWEPFDKRFELELAAYNLFDEDFEVGSYTPGWGRSFVGSLKVRF
ncbi:tetratricopeptide repeat protein [Mesorhizobium soli]|uniref:TonB-dependent receptor n=1 Tax=Pseudaminobacter soli (ex Li et al. 2025) TaxID=1295366 RepID=A0A2P7SK74_9HYPH|nr:tetratricopeptide repeat protein [Mesorhizobium soli]PSJ62751.1 TonB-dependent receptor [Mesorhizobium soli]